MEVKCAWCDRVKQPNGRWAVDPQAKGPFTHSICEGCKNDLLSDLKKIGETDG